MIDKQLINYLRLLHGSFNITIMFLFIYQGSLGLRIRKGRISLNQDFRPIKRHRRLGPILALLGVLGFFAGVALVYIDAGNLLKYPPHFIIGLAIASLIITTYTISRKIRSIDSPYRNLHFRIGIIILSLYLIQAILGLGILL